MKKFFLQVALFLAIGISTPLSANAQSWGDALKNVASSAISNGSVSNIITSLIGTSTIKQSDVVGTWTYSSPVLVLESNNLLNKAGAAVMQSTAEKKITAMLNKYGINAGKIKITFNSDNTYECYYGKVPSKGTYKIDGAKLSLMKLGKTALTCNAKLSGKELQLSVPANKVLSFINTLGAAAKSNSTLTSLTTFMKGYSGMQVGFKLKK